METDCSNACRIYNKICDQCRKLQRQQTLGYTPIQCGSTWCYSSPCVSYSECTLAVAAHIKWHLTATACHVIG